MKHKYTSIQNIQYFLACVLFASLNFEMFCPIVEKFSVTKMAAYLYVGGMLLTPWDIFKIKAIETPLASILIMYFLMMISSIINIQNNSTIFNSTIFLNIIIFWILLNHQRKDSRVFKKGFFWFSVSCCIMGLLFLNGIGLTFDSIGRVRIFGDNSNATGTKMAIGFLYLLNYCLNNSPEKKIYRPWLLVLVVPMAYLLFATASRTALLELVAGSLLFVYFRESKNKKGRIQSLIIGAMALIVGYSIVSKQDVVMSRMNDTIEEGNISGRDEIWEKYLVVIEQHPILGGGFTGHYQYAQNVLGQAMSPHNVLIEVTLYSGIIGLSFFLLFLYQVFINAWRYHKRRHNIGPLITCVAVIAMVLSGQALGVKVFWVLCAYAISYKFSKVNLTI